MEFLGTALSYVTGFIVWGIGAIVLLVLSVFALLITTILIGILGTIIFGILILLKEFVKEITRPLWEGVARLWRRMKK